MLRPLPAGGFTLVEALVAMAVCLLGLSGILTATSQGIRLVRSGKEIASASQMLQQRVESFRYTSTWPNITTAAGLTTLVIGATPTASNFRNATETFSVEPYPAGGTPLVATRTPAGVITTTGATLSTQQCVKFTVQVSWSGLGNVQRSRQVSTIMTKGGL